MKLRKRIPQRIKTAIKRMNARRANLPVGVKGRFISCSRIEYVVLWLRFLEHGSHEYVSFFLPFEKSVTEMGPMILEGLNVLYFPFRVAFH